MSTQDKLKEEWVYEHKRMRILLDRIRSHHDQLFLKDRTLSNTNVINYREFNDQLATMLKEC